MGQRSIVRRAMARVRRARAERERRPLAFGGVLVVVLAVGGVLSHLGAAAEPKPEDTADPKLALLIGCTEYDNPSIRDLSGPANDLVLMHDLLTARFGFSPRDITVLAEGHGPAFRPTRKNIEREFRALERKVRGLAESGKKARVVIYFSGHGTRQPDGEQDELDGWDEVLLPADTGPWDAGGKRILNAIVDDELGKWTRAISSAPAHLWVIIDACHSGTALRGGKGSSGSGGEEEDVSEVARFVRSGNLGVPEKPDVVGGAGEFRNEREQADDTLVVFYAALPNEKAIERIPYGSRDGIKYGLFTHTMCRVLSESPESLSYEELIRRVRRRYRGWRRKKPNPYAAGRLKQNKVLLDRRTNPSITIQRDSTDTQRVLIDAGFLRGVNRGSILAVYSRDTESGGGLLIGHVTVVEAQPFWSVVQPIVFDGQKAPELAELKEGAVCKLKEVDWGTLQITLGFDEQAVREQPRPLTRNQQVTIDRIAGVLRDLTKDGMLPLRVVESWKGADWVVQWRGVHLFLLPNHLAVTLGDLPSDTAVVRLDDKGAEEIVDVVLRVARSENLLRLASAFASSGRHQEGSIRVEWEIRDVRTGKPLEPGVVLHDGQTVRWRVRNVCEHEVYVAVYYLDAAFGVVPVMTWDEPLRPQTSVPWHESLFRAPPNGLEHFLIIATKKVGSQPPPDFSSLVQSSVELRKPVAMRSWKKEQTRWDDLSPLERLLVTATSRSPQRSAKASDLDAYQLQLFPVEVVGKSDAR